MRLADAQPVRLASAAPQATELSDDEQQTALIAGFIIAFGLATMLSGGCKMLRERRPPPRRRPAASPRKAASKYQRAPLAADEEAAPPPRRAPGGQCAAAAKIAFKNELRVDGGHARVQEGAPRLAIAAQRLGVAEDDERSARA